MHYHGPFFAGLCPVHVQVPGAVVAELLSDAFPVHVGKAVHQHPVRIPVAPDSFALAVFPESFARKSSAHAVGVEYTGFLDVPREPRRQS